MAKLVIIPVISADVTAAISKICSFEGKSLSVEGVSMYDNVRITNQDSAILEEFIRDARNYVVTALNRFSSFAESVITLTLGNTFNAAHEASTIDLLQKYITYYSVARWFELKGVPQKAEEYKAKAQESFMLASGNVYAKTPPPRPIKQGQEPETYPEPGIEQDPVI